MTRSTKVLILVAQQRSGTNALLRTLGRGRKIQTFGEVFHEDQSVVGNYFYFRKVVLERYTELFYNSINNMYKLWSLYIDYLADISQNKPFIALDVKYNSWHHFNSIWYLTGDRPLLLDIIRDNNCFVVHIVRNDLFAQACSAIIAEKRKRFHSTEPIPEEYLGRVIIDPCEVIERINISRSQTERFREYFKNYHSISELVYETMFTGNGTISDNTKEALSTLIGEDCDGNSLIPLQRITGPLSTVVENGDALVEFFRGSEYEEFVRAAFDPETNSSG